AGAEVRAAGDSRLLGTTPFAIRLPREDRVATFELSKQGYTTVTEELALAGDGSIGAALTAVPAAATPEPPKPPVEHHRPRPKPTKPAAAVDRGGTIDVFGGH